MDTDAHGSGFICVHPCSSVVMVLSALTGPLITVGSSAWSGEFGVYEPFDAERFKFFVAIPDEGMGRKVAPLQKTGLNSIPRWEVGLPWDFNRGFVSSTTRCARDPRA